MVPEKIAEKGKVREGKEIFVPGNGLTENRTAEQKMGGVFIGVTEPEEWRRGTEFHGVGIRDTGQQPTVELRAGGSVSDTYHCGEDT